MFNHYIHLLLRPIAISQALHGQSDSCILVIVQSQNVAERGKIPAPFFVCPRNCKVLRLHTEDLALLSRHLSHGSAYRCLCRGSCMWLPWISSHVTATGGKNTKDTINSMWIPNYIIFYPEHTSGAFFKRIPPTKTLYHVQLGIFGSALGICTSSGRIHYSTWLKNPCWLSISTQHLNRRFWRCSKESSSTIRSSKGQISM